MKDSEHPLEMFPLRLCVKIVVMINAETQRRGDAEGTFQGDKRYPSYPA